MGELIPFRQRPGSAIGDRVPVPGAPMCLLSLMRMSEDLLDPANAHADDKIVDYVQEFEPQFDAAAAGENRAGYEEYRCRVRDCQASCITDDDGEMPVVISSHEWRTLEEACAQSAPPPTRVS